MKKTILSLTITAVIIFSALFTGCDNAADENPVSGDIDLSSVNGFSLDSFDIETDFQTYYFCSSTNQMAACDEGYYYFGSSDEGNTLLYFLDKESKKAVPLCSKPDCAHGANGSEITDCNAYFTEWQYYDNFGIFYYNSNLYLLGNDGTWGSNSLYLYKISKDGTSREQVCHIADFGSEIGNMLIEFIIHRGVCYLSYTEDDKASLYAFNIDESEPELTKIDEISGVGAELYRLCSCDDGISYQYGRFTDETLEEFEGGIRLYLNGTSQTVLKNAIKSYIITNGKIYYATENGIKIYSLGTGETSDLNGASYEYINFDGNYFYLFDNETFHDDSDDKVCVYDKNENYICEFTTPGHESDYLRFGDENYFFCDSYDSINGIDYSYSYYFDKSQIESGSIEWEIIEK